jgi:CRISPR/Cas system-associated exonuclease Cas4 (RecB family)
MRTIRASEVGTYLFCQRAWWYMKTGAPAENLAEMAAGSELHFQHGQKALGVSCLRSLAYFLLLIALVVIAIYFTNRLF